MTKGVDGVAVIKGLVEIPTGCPTLAAANPSKLESGTVLLGWKGLVEVRAGRAAGTAKGLVEAP